LIDENEASHQIAALSSKFSPTFNFSGAAPWTKPFNVLVPNDANFDDFGERFANMALQNCFFNVHQKIIRICFNHSGNRNIHPATSQACSNNCYSKSYRMSGNDAYRRKRVSMCPTHD
jgi:hypothetical protein